MQSTPQNNLTEFHRFEAFFNHASMGIVVVNSQSLIQSVNPFALKLFGYSAEEIINKPIEVLIPRRYHHKHVDHRNAYTQNPKSRPMGVGLDLFAVKKDGTEFPVEVSLGNYDNNGDKNVIAFISDISVRKKAEVEIEKLNDELEATVEQRTKDLRETMEQLEISKDRLEDALSFQKAILANAGAMIIGTDENGIIKTFNPEAEKELGFTAAELIDKQKPLLFHDADEVRNRAQELTGELKKNINADMEVFFAKARLGLHNEYEWTYIHKNGSRFPVLLNVTAMKDDENNIIGFLGVALNISESKKTEQELQHALEKEKELSELKSRFVSMASHEFRTPLSTVLSSSYLIEKYTSIEDQPKREKHLQRIVSSVNMLTDILNDFLSLGKIEEGKIQVRFTKFNIQELVMAIAGEIKNNLKKQQKIKYYHNGGTEVHLDASLLKHIVMNLVSNASKFSPETSPIEIKTVCMNNHITLSVKDHGIGIAKEDQKHLMERFFRGANAGNIQGTGLGLHIVSKYAELMHGKVECKSQLEKGTEFIITFTKNTN
jgi:PAS domain S-box-containing protein